MGNFGLGILDWGFWIGDFGLRNSGGGIQPRSQSDLPALSRSEQRNDRGPACGRRELLWIRMFRARQTPPTGADINSKQEVGNFRFTYIAEDAKVVYLSKDGKNEKIFDALEWLAAMPACACPHADRCSHVPNKACPVPDTGARRWFPTPRSPLPVTGSMSTPYLPVRDRTQTGTLRTSSSEPEIDMRPEG